MCSRISSVNALSSRHCAACPFSFAHIVRSLPIASPLPLELQYPVHNARYALPVLGFPFQLFRALLCDRVEACAPVVLACSPFGSDPPLLLQPQQRGIHRSFVEVENSVTYLLDSPRDAEP